MANLKGLEISKIFEIHTSGQPIEKILLSKEDFNTYLKNRTWTSKATSIKAILALLFIAFMSALLLINVDNIISVPLVLIISIGLGFGIFEMSRKMTQSDNRIKSILHSKKELLCKKSQEVFSLKWDNPILIEACKKANTEETKHIKLFENDIEKEQALQKVLKENIENIKKRVSSLKEELLK